MVHTTSSISILQRVAACTGLITALTFTAPVTAQAESTESGAQGKPRPKLILEAGDHELSDVIDRAARYLKKNYLYNTQEMTNAGFRLQAGVAMDKENCENFVSQMAYAKGFAMTPVNRALNVYEFIALRGQHRARVFAQAEVMTPEQVKKNARRYVAITTTVTFKHLDAFRASQHLRPLFASSNSNPLSFAGISKNSLIISGFAPEVARALRLLEMADVPAPPEPPRTRTTQSRRK